MSWIYLPAGGEAARQVESCGTSDTQTGVKSALSNTTSSVSEICASECGTRSSQKQRSGTMSPPSTLHPGLESFLAYLQATHARPGQQAGSTVEKKTPTTCGPMSFEYYGVLSQQNGASWRTHPCFVDLPITEESFPTWHPSGLMRSGKLARLPAWAQIISAADSGSIAGGMIPTPCARDHKGKTAWENQMKHSLPNVVEMFPTPQASDNRDRGHLGHPSIQRRERIGKQLNLSMVADPEKKSGALNSDWIEWVMAWIPGWTRPEPLQQADIDLFDQKMLDGTWWAEEPPIPRVGKNLPNRKQRLMALGNGWVPLCAAVAFMDLEGTAECLKLTD